MSDILAGKVVVVTSASSGLGRATSLSAARHGAKAVLVADITETPREGGRPTVAAATALGVAAQFVRTDVIKRGDLDARVAAAVEFGGIDVMVANAGITAHQDSADVTEADFDRLVAVNLKGVLFNAQAAAEAMKAQGRPGSIVLMASMGGIAGAGFTWASPPARAAWC